jgi:hypothetical protein
MIVRLCDRRTPITSFSFGDSPAAIGQTLTQIGVLQSENEDPWVPLPRPETCGKTYPSTERGYGRLFAG